MKQFADMLRDRFLEWVYAMDPDKLSVDKAAEFARLLRRLHQAGTICGH